MTTPNDNLPERCDLLIRNGYVITMDADNSKHPNGAIAVRGRDIVAVGPDSELSSRFKPLRTLDARGGAVHPGYIDLHYHISGHLPSKLLDDGVASSAGAGRWIASRYERFFNALGDEEEHASAMLAGLDMLCNGFTSFTEPGTVHSTDAVADACNALGIRAWVGDPWLMDVGGEGHLNISRAPFDTKRSLSLLGGELKRNADPDSLVRGHVAIYGSGTQTDELMEAAKACADDNDVTFNSHQSMSQDDSQRNGTPAYLHWAEKGVLDSKCLFIHSNVIREPEIQPVLDSGLTIAWVPGNSFYYGQRRNFPNRIAELYHRGLNVGFGLDVNKTWVFGQNTLLAYNMAREEGQVLYPDDLLKIQTINGARALKADHLIGSIEPGKRADIVIRSLSDPWNYPVHHVERDIALYSLTRNVDTVLVDGRIVIKNGRHTMIDEEVIFQQGQKAAETLLAAGS